VEEFPKQEVQDDLDNIIVKLQVTIAELNEARNLATNIKNLVRSNQPRLDPSHTNLAVVKSKTILEHLRSCHAEIKRTYDKANSVHQAVKQEKEIQTNGGTDSSD